jgi:transcriptional antiterminator NusG
MIEPSTPVAAAPAESDAAHERPPAAEHNDTNPAAEAAPADTTPTAPAQDGAAATAAAETPAQEQETRTAEPAAQAAAPPPPSEPEAPPAADEPPPAPSNKHWYVVKVQSGREESIKEAIERRVKIEGLEEFFGQVVIPVERVTEVRNNKRVVKERKLYPGYLMCEVEYNDRILYLFRETSGVGDFVGGSLNHPPQPMKQAEVDRMLGAIPTPGGKEVHIKPKFDRGDRVRVRDGTFAGMEGEIKDLLEAKGAVRVELTIFGRPVPVELEYWQVEQTS